MGEDVEARRPWRQRTLGMESLQEMKRKGLTVHRIAFEFVAVLCTIRQGGKAACIVVTATVLEISSKNPELYSVQQRK